MREQDGSGIGAGLAPDGLVIGGQCVLRGACPEPLPTAGSLTPDRRATTMGRCAYRFSP